MYRTGKGTQFVEALKRVAGGEGHAEIISVMELLTFVVMAAARRQQWEGQTILYVTDNANVQAWLRNRRSKNLLRTAMCVRSCCWSSGSRPNPTSRWMECTSVPTIIA